MISGTIGEPVLYHLLDDMKKDGYRDKERLRLFIDSHGGKIASALTMARFLMSAFNDIETYAIGSVDSAAVTLYLCGQRRIAYETSRFFLHPAGIEVNGVQTAQQLRTILKGLQAESEAMISFYAERTALPASYWRRVLSNEQYLSAETAREKQIVTDITTTPTTFPQDGLILTA